MVRFFDIIFSTLALVCLAPLLVPLLLALRFTGEGEVFFLQERVGLGGKVFRLFKFATMLKDSPNLGTGPLTVSEDPRILPFGKFLRKTKINELPQLLNIALGDMSIIGPRPVTKKSLRGYPSHVQALLSTVLPGLSGIGSIIFRREEDILQGDSASVEFYDEVIAPYKSAVEEWFVHRNSLFIYFLCIFLTVWVIFFPSSGAVWRVFKDLPVPPTGLMRHLNYPYTDLP